MNKRTEYDITIIGAGPAGCAAALILQKHANLSVLVIDRGQKSQHKVGESIPPDSRLLFQQLGIWQEFLNQGHDKCLGNSSSWGDSNLGYSDFIYNPMGHGWHLDRTKFDDFMLDQLKIASVDISLNTKFIHSCFEDNQFRLSLQKNKNNLEIKSKFVIDASGSRSNFARKQGAQKVINDNLVCLSAFFKTQDAKSFNHLTLLEAVEYGWWYSAKLPNNHLVVALSCEKSFYKEFKINQFKHWFKLLNHHCQHIHPKMSQYQAIDKKIIINLSPSFILDKIHDNQWVAIGDAGSCYDPISAQGIYKALANGITAALALIDKFAGNDFALKKYETIVRIDYDNYIANKNHFYSQENRWPHSPFWNNRKSFINEATG